MTNKEVFRILNDDLTTTRKYFGEENVVAIFSYGVINEEFYEEEITTEDVNTEVIFIPSFEEFCIGGRPKVHYIDSCRGTLIKCLDIRLLTHATKSGHIECIEALFTPFYIINARYIHIFETYLTPNRDKIKAGIISNEPAEELKIGLTKIMRYHFNDTSPTVKFIKQLTDAEKIALKGIVQKFGDEAIIKQGKLASELGLSRITFTKLVAKMKKNSIAIIEHRGPEGTYYKILDDTLLNITGDDL